MRKKGKFAGLAWNSKKNAPESRNPEIRQTRKNKNWHFGMKLHAGAGERCLVHSLTTTHAGTVDTTQVPMLLHGGEEFRSPVALPTPVGHVQ